MRSTGPSRFVVPHNSLELGPGDGAWRGGGGRQARAQVSGGWEALPGWLSGACRYLGTRVEVITEGARWKAGGCVTPMGRVGRVSHQWAVWGMCHTSGVEVVSCVHDCVSALATHELSPAMVCQHREGMPHRKVTLQK